MNLHKLTVSKLKELAREKGVKFPSKIRKAEIIKLLATGCEHYKRPFKLVAKCCGEAFWCHYCHDEQSDHQIDRFVTENMVCACCGTEQELADRCANDKCVKHTEPVQYFCGKCALWIDEEKDVFHCSGCGLCRLGIAENFFHCEKCCFCIHISKRECHKCIENIGKTDCPVCLEDFFASRIPVLTMRCGHLLHEPCLSQCQRSRIYNCPLCKKTFDGLKEKLTEKIDEILENEMWPEIFSLKRSRVFCNDCEERSVAKWHYRYHKCQNCSSYNTSILEVFEECEYIGIAEMFGTA